MVIKEWALVRKFYKENYKRLTKDFKFDDKGRLYWASQVNFFLLYVPAAAIILRSAIPVLLQRNPPPPTIPLEMWSAIGVALVGLGCGFLLKDRALSKAFKAEYERYDIAGHSIFKREQFLRYALFLQDLKAYGLSHDAITRLKQFAETLKKPQPTVRTGQHVLVTTLISILVVTTIEALKASKLLENVEVTKLIIFHVAYILVFVSFCVWWWNGVTSRHTLTKAKELELFLRWAELDTTAQPPDPTANGAQPMHATPVYPCTRVKMP